MLHLSIGEEGAAAGVCAALKPQDNFTTHHRGHGVFLARGADPNRMMAEIAAARPAIVSGKGGSMHIADRALGHLGRERDRRRRHPAHRRRWPRVTSG